MAVSSTMLELGTQAPGFSLPDVSSGQTVSLDDFDDKKALLVVFLCAHCPYVVHIQPELARIALDYAATSFGIVGITSNDIAQYPQDAPQPTAEMARRAGLTFPVLFDETQAVAKAFSAACTPDFFLFNDERRLAYRGQLDDSRPGRGQLNGADLRAAVNAVLAGEQAGREQKPSIGCNIKWKPGNEPAYF